MKALAANLLLFLRRSPQFMIPIYQRNYSWGNRECAQFWEDIYNSGSDSSLKDYFIGSVVYVESSGNVMTPEPLMVIDGQQRLTTTTLLIAALAKHFSDQENKDFELLESFSKKKLINYYLTNPDESGERKFKLLLSEADKDTLLSIVGGLSIDGGKPMPADVSTRVADAFKFFQDRIVANSGDLETVCKGIAKLQIVDVALERDRDNPQLIFESMNSTGKALTKSDQIRNFILMGLGHELQTDLYKTFWRPMEKGFGRDAYSKHFDAFIRQYLIAKTGNIPKENEVYEFFKKWYATRQQTDGPSDVTTRNLVQDIGTYAEYYCVIALGRETTNQLKHAFHDIRELKVDVAYPLFLYLYNEYKRQKLTDSEFVDIVRMVESYVFRRTICGLPPNSLDKIFASIVGRMLAGEGKCFEKIKAEFLLLPSYRRFPSDDEFIREFKEKDIYNFRNRGYWLRRLENYGRNERVIVEDYTIEHIMPQNANLSEDWKIALGSDWMGVQERWLHKLGNLTLTAYNSEYSDHSFTFKCREVKDKNGEPIGFAVSPLKLNTGLGQLSSWNEDAIKARADRLAAIGVKVWSFPKLEPSVLDSYRVTPEIQGQQFNVESYPQLATGIARELFESLRQQVLELDPCVREEYFRTIIAYKAETNFVDVVPQVRKLRLVLNLPFQDIDDPRGLCFDVSTVGHLGSGDVGMILSSPDDLPYAMGLIRQAYDCQMEGVQED